MRPHVDGHKPTTERRSGRTVHAWIACRCRDAAWLHIVHFVRTAVSAVPLSRFDCTCGCRLAIAAAAVSICKSCGFVISAFLKICLETLGGEGSKHIRMWLIFWTRQNGGEDTPVLTIS